jgi:hypothetical protein
LLSLSVSYDSSGGSLLSLSVTYDSDLCFKRAEEVWACSSLSHGSSL